MFQKKRMFYIGFEKKRRFHRKSKLEKKNFFFLLVSLQKMKRTSISDKKQQLFCGLQEDEELQKKMEKKEGRAMQQQY